MPDRVTAYRRALHEIPELGKALPKTIAYVKNVLAPLSCRVTEPTEGAVCAYFDFGRAETAAFRCDMDALPVRERTGLPFQSRHEGNMHACGHDGHTAMVLELANRLDAMGNTPPRNALLIFQPAEEGPGGANDICRTGIFERLHVTRVFGLHLWPGLPAGTLWTKPGPMMAKNSEVDVIIRGRSAHIARRSQAIDALQAGAELLLRVYDMAARELPPEEPRVISFGKMTSGTVRNVVSDRCEINGTVRVFSHETFDFITRRCRELAAALEAEYGCAAEVRFSEGYPPVDNDPDLTGQMFSFFGAEGLHLLPRPDMTAEDFSFYQRCAPGVFTFLGVGDAAALHSPDFTFDDEAVLPVGVEYYLKLLDMA